MLATKGEKEARASLEEAREMERVAKRKAEKCKAISRKKIVQGNKYSPFAVKDDKKIA